MDLLTEAYLSIYETANLTFNYAPISKENVKFQVAPLDQIVAFVTQQPKPFDGIIIRDSRTRGATEIRPFYNNEQTIYTVMPHSRQDVYNTGKWFTDLSEAILSVTN